MLIKHILNIVFKISFQVPLSTHVVKVDAILLLIRQRLHLVAYEADDLIFNKILQPLCEFSSQNPVVGQSSQPPSLEEDDEPPRKVARKSRLST